MFRDKKILGGLAAAALLMAGMGSAVAQLNNKPFSFRNSPGGLGMSQGGRQAIINDELFGSRPDNLQRTFDGELVDVVEGPNNTAIIFRQGTRISIPGSHGTSYKGDNPLLRAGIFNPYFGPSDNNNFVIYTDTRYHSAALINSWTINVADNKGGYAYNSANPVDSWTAFVNTLNKM